MATVTICDVKACGDVIKGDVYNTQIANNKYQLCKKCNDGLLKFLNDNLNKLDTKAEAPIQKLEGEGMQKFLDEWSKIKITNIPPSGWGQGLYTPNPGILYTTPYTVPYTVTTGDPAWAVTTGGTVDVIKK